jgi:hypothetical protein
MNVLAYNFPGSDPGAIWNIDTGGGATVAQVSGEGVVTLPSGAAGSSHGAFVTSRYYNLHSDSVSVEVTNAGNTATTAATHFELSSPNGSFLQIYQQSGTISFQYGDGGAVITTLKSGPYDPVNHLYWRFREDGINTYWDTSADGAAWTTQAQTTTATMPVAIDLLDVQFVATTNGGEINPGAVHFAKVNGGGTPTGQWCPMSTIVDNFNATAPSTQWARRYADPPETVTQGSGQLLITLASTANVYGGYGSSASYRLTGSAILVQVPVVPTAATGAQAFVSLAAPGNNALAMVEENATLSARVTVAGTSTIVGSFSYDATQHAWWRIRESGGTIYWETAPDGKTWTTQATNAALAFGIDVLDVNLSGGTWQAVASPGMVAYSSLNLPPP